MFADKVVWRIRPTSNTTFYFNCVLLEVTKLLYSCFGTWYLWLTQHQCSLCFFSRRCDVTYNYAFYHYPISFSILFSTFPPELLLMWKPLSNPVKLLLTEQRTRFTTLIRNAASECFHRWETRRMQHIPNKASLNWESQRQLKKISFTLTTPIEHLYFDNLMDLFWKTDLHWWQIKCKNMYPMQVGHICRTSHVTKACYIHLLLDN